MKSINLIRRRRRVGCVPGRCVDFLVRCDPVDGTRSWWRTWRWVGTKRAFSIWKKSSPAGRSVASPESPIHPCKQKATFSIKKARGGRESDAAMARSGGQRRGRKSTGGWGWVEGGGGTMQPDASYSHLRGRTRGPLPLLYHYARAGKTSRLVGRGWGEEKDGTEGGVGEDGSVDRSGWCIGTNAFAVKTGDARGNGVFLQQQPARGVWIWAKESDTVGGWIVSRGRVPYTAALCLFLKLLFQTLTTSIFLSPFLPLFAFSLLAHLYAGEWTRDRRSPGGKRFYELAARAARWSMIRIGSSTCFFLQEKKKKLEEYISFSIRFLLLLWVKGEMSSNNRSTCNIFNFIEC